jgi:hypothetical protein
MEETEVIALYQKSRVRCYARREDDIKMDLEKKKLAAQVWIGFTWLKVNFNGGGFVKIPLTAKFHKRRETS